MVDDDTVVRLDLRQPGRDADLIVAAAARVLGLMPEVERDAVMFRFPREISADAARLRVAVALEETSETIWTDYLRFP